MTVGDFYKQLVVDIPKDFHSYYEKTKALIKEARTSFPIKKGVSGYDLERLAELYQAYVTEVLEWFVKYFGLDESGGLENEN